jgi:hypothetical protein
MRRRNEKNNKVREREGGGGEKMKRHLFASVRRGRGFFHLELVAKNFAFQRIANSFYVRALTDYGSRPFC